MKLGFAAAASVVLAGVGWAQVTQRVSVASDGTQGDFPSQILSVSANGRYVAFGSYASNLVPGDTNGDWDVFVRDLQFGTTERVSVATGGAQGNSGTGYDTPPAISADGRYVAFASLASNMVPGDTNGAWDIFVRDRLNGTTELVSIAVAGGFADSGSYRPAITPDGRFVAFESLATNLIVGDNNFKWDIFVRDRVNGTTDRVSVSTSGTEANDDSYVSAISADGRYVAFESRATNLASGDTNGVADIFVHDRLTGTTERMSLAPGGVEANGVSYNPAISADGQFVGFTSMASNLVPGDTNATADVFIHDRLGNWTELVSVSMGGTVANGVSGNPAVSDTGRYVAFDSRGTDIVSGDANGHSDIFLRDRVNGTTELVSITTSGVQGNGDSGIAKISSDLRIVAFISLSTNLVSGDTNGAYDAFVRDRDASSFKSLCESGVAGVIACPCSNPPNGSGRGCDNSAFTGGAILTASGIAYLSIDSLVFTTSAEMPTATSILLQGNAFAPSGIVYGQGVRCVAGTLKRLFVKAAVAGSITAPDFAAGDPTVSARSAAKGDVIQPGQSRWYLVYYRDPTVLGGCPASATFNATQTGQVTWWP